MPLIKYVLAFETSLNLISFLLNWSDIIELLTSIKKKSLKQTPKILQISPTHVDSYTNLCTFLIHSNLLSISTFLVPNLNYDFCNWNSSKYFNTHMNYMIYLHHKVTFLFLVQLLLRSCSYFQTLGLETKSDTHGKFQNSLTNLVILISLLVPKNIIFKQQNYISNFELPFSSYSKICDSNAKYHISSASPSQYVFDTFVVRNSQNEIKNKQSYCLYQNNSAFYCFQVVFDFDSCFCSKLIMYLGLLLLFGSR